MATKTKTVLIAVRVSPEAQKKLQFIGKQLGLTKGSRVNVSAVVHACIDDKYSELKEPKFDFNASF